MEAFADRGADVLVIAILGWAGATLALSDAVATPTGTDGAAGPAGAVAGPKLPPDNARVADFLSYDAVLAHADAWVHNAGFGAVNHGIAHGVPMVVAGEGMDKTENARRVAWSGVGIDLGTARPTRHMVRRAVDTVLEDGSWRERVGALRRESEELDPCGIIHEELLRLDASEREKERGILQDHTCEG
jgi:UDP:flavonoid glycosyltransferase YjiC (YdhE family)